MKLDWLMKILQRKLIDKVDPQKGVEHLRAADPQRAVEPQNQVKLQKLAEQSRVVEPQSQVELLKLVDQSKAVEHRNQVVFQFLVKNLIYVLIKTKINIF